MTYNRVIVEKKIKSYLEEDCSYKDISSSLIPENSQVSAKIIAKSEGYISGLEELKILWELLKVTSKFRKKDGEKVLRGEVVVELKGNTRDILLGERTGLNLVSCMSAITTTVRKFKEIIKSSGKNVRIACTRKTHPGIRIFEKKAVELGHGDTHRYTLDDMVLLKDTHLKFYNGDVAKILNDIKEKTSFSKKIEIEIERVEDVLIAAQNGADIIMLDNMNSKTVETAIELLIRNNLRKKVIIEISGGIRQDNIRDYLQISNPPDVISTSELTLFPSEKLDLSLEFD